jgi:hypothetical protein
VFYGGTAEPGQTAVHTMPDVVSIVFFGLVALVLPPTGDSPIVFNNNLCVLF